MIDEIKRHMICLGRMYADNFGGYFTLTPEHLYIHDKKKLYESNEVFKFGTPDKEEFAISMDGGETWEYSYLNGILSLKVHTDRNGDQP